MEAMKAAVFHKFRFGLIQALLLTAIAASAPVSVAARESTGLFIYLY